MDRILRLGIIGFGGMAGYHNSLLSRDPRFRVVGVYDIDAAANKRALDLGLCVFDSAEELLSSDIDAVLIATPNDSHKQYAVDACSHKKHIICEKPAAMNAAEVEKMYAAAKASQSILFVHQNRRWDSDYLTALGIIGSDEIGRVYRIESRVMGSHGIPGKWRKEKAKGGGMMLDWGVHLIDQILCAVDSKIIGIFCTYSYLEGCEVDDGFSLMMEFQNGLKATVTVDTNSFISLPRWQLYGEDGTASITDWSVKGKIVSVLERIDPELRAIKAGNGFTKTMADRSQSTVVETEPKIIKPKGGEFYDAFYDSVVYGKPPLVTKEQVMRVMRLMESAAESAQTKKYLEIEL